MYTISRNLFSFIHTTQISYQFGGSSQLEYDSSLPDESQETVQISMLKTISTTLNDIQTKLSTIQNQYTQQETQLKRLKESIINSERTGGQEKNPNKSPSSQIMEKSRGLSYISYASLIINNLIFNFYCFRLACICNIHATLPAEGQYDASKR